MNKIIDKNGYVIEVTNLKEAIKQADNFRFLKHTAKAYRSFDKERQAYWQDLYEKLLALQQMPST